MNGKGMKNNGNNNNNNNGQLIDRLCANNANSIAHTHTKTKHGKMNAKHMFRIIINTRQLNASFE